ncbi:hypothetical protein Q5P01_011266 [Channa striata]|uniref:Sugar transporter SWEET1 n=1 Tax=Channa striata TaxID=64152 RepID=A0AA88MZ48_CHASR|nr:hypothetical protein Q5P01_011266 [Channa striata]
MFSTGLTDLKKMKESKSADNIQFLPFLTTCLNNLGWLYYGLLKGTRRLSWSTLLELSFRSSTSLCILTTQSIRG